MVLQTAQEQTVQKLPDAKKSASMMDTIAWITQRDAMLPVWGTRYRERVLRAYYRHELNTLVQGAFQGLIKKVKSAPWEIKGPKSGVQYFQEVLRGSHFDSGWGDFLQMTLLDYLRQDIGAFVEVIGPGPSDGPLTGRFTGLAQLDAMQCYATGDPEFPVIYQDDKGNRHLMHHTRIIHFVDGRDGDERKYKTVGLCALSRAIAVVQREILMNQYISGQLDDNPPPGLMVAKNLDREKVQQALAAYGREQQTDLGSTWGRTVWLYAMMPDYPVEIESITFGNPPDKFDYRVYKVDVDVNELALAIGIDVQEIWQLSGGSKIGTGTQSEILHSKSQGKMFGDILKMLERAINSALPPAYEFQFKFTDPQDDLQQAQIAETWVRTIQTAANSLTPDEQRRILAAKIQAIQDAITDENGQIVRLDDADPVEEVAADDTGPAPEEPAAVQDDEAMGVAKAFSDTRSEFVRLVMDAIEGAQGGDLARRRFGTVMRAHLRRLGQQAYQDGLEEGGVNPEDMDDRDRAALQEWLSIQSPFVTNFANRVFSNELSEAQIAAHAEMWGNKSLRDAFQLGQASAQWNQVFEWVLGPTGESCSDCLRLSGQRHRMRDWRKKGWLPGAEKLECSGYNCLCSLEPTPGERSRGRF